MKQLIVLLGLFVSSLASANPTVLRAADLGWEVHFDAPPTEKIEERSTASAYHYAGNAGKFNLSLFLERPQCSGDASNKSQVACFLGLIEKSPGLVKQTIRFNDVAQGTQVSYLVRLNVNGKPITMLHTHILFADQGIWGDLHGSVIGPDKDDVAMLIGLGEGFGFSH